MNHHQGSNIKVNILPVVKLLFYFTRIELSVSQCQLDYLTNHIDKQISPYIYQLHSFGGEHFLSPLEVIFLSGVGQGGDIPPRTICSFSSSETTLIGMGFSRESSGWDEEVGMRF